MDSDGFTSEWRDFRSSLSKSLTWKERREDAREGIRELCDSLGSPSLREWFRWYQTVPGDYKFSPLTGDWEVGRVSFLTASTPEEQQDGFRQLVRSLETQLYTVKVIHRSLKSSMEAFLAEQSENVSSRSFRTVGRSDKIATALESGSEERGVDTDTSMANRRSDAIFWVDSLHHNFARWDIPACVELQECEAALQASQGKLREMTEGSVRADSSLLPSEAERQAVRRVLQTVDERVGDWCKDISRAIDLATTLKARVPIKKKVVPAECRKPGG